MSLLAQVFLLSLIGVCCGLDYAEYNTTEPPPNICGANMICVPENVCINDIVDEAGTMHIQPRFTCPDGEKCCHINNTNQPLITTPTATASEANTKAMPVAITLATGCGYRNEGGVAGQFKGITNQTEFGEFPWVLSVIHSTRRISVASLIHPRIALTAAHNVREGNVNDLVVRAGEWKFDSVIGNPLPIQERQVSEKVLHEQFNKDNLRFDIALLFLQTPFDLKPHINTVCLPQPNYTFDESPCYVTGFGVIKKSEDSYVDPMYLKKVSLKLVPNPMCQHMLRRTYLSRYFRLHPSFICAGGGIDEDACFGDGGSPLVCEMNGIYYQAGTVSWGLGSCNMENVPGIYASMSYLRTWVDRKLSEKGIDSSSYTQLFDEMLL